MKNKAASAKNGLTVHGVGGAHVVLLCFNLPPTAVPGLLGFAIHRTDSTDPNEIHADWLEGMKRFEATDPHFAPPARYPTNRHPVQDFFWSDFTAKPGHSYTYRILALKGTPDNLVTFDEVSVDIQTVSDQVGDHCIAFNRGAASSQEYVRRFGDTVPDPKGDISDPRLKWLSRGAYETILAFLARAKDNGFGLRVAAYEFHYQPFLNELRSALDRGVDLQIVFDAKDNSVPADEKHRGQPAFPRDVNHASIAAAKLGKVSTPRTNNKADISHNKFIVLLEKGNPVAVLTGSTNFSAGGIYGQANVVHVINDPVVAQAYFTYWTQLQGDPKKPALQSSNSNIVLPTASKGVANIFSPRSQEDALALYASFASQAQDALMMTFAFGMNPAFFPAYQTGRAKLRYALFEKLLGPAVRKNQIAAATKQMMNMRFMPENLFAVGSTMPMNALDNWVKEKLTGLNVHVQFIHTKFMLVDPLGPNPIVITGSANFSKASSVDNDENMMVIQGNTEVADVYLGEYMRLWEHYAFREFMQRRDEKKKKSGVDPAITHLSGPRPGFLDPSDGWTAKHFGNTPSSNKRQYFSSF